MGNFVHYMNGRLNIRSRQLCGTRRVCHQMTQQGENKMGRPIKKKFFGNLNSGGVGGEGFLSVAVLNTGTNSFYSTSTAVTWTASAPQLAGGTAASGTATVSGAGRVTALNITSAGSGYTSTSSVTVTLSPATTGTAATYRVALTAAVQNAIAVSAYVPGGSSGVAGDIVKQESSKRYLVRTAQGIGQCRLTAVAGGSLASGQMNIIATDVNASTYYVTKLTARRATLTTATNVGGFEYTSGSIAGWTLGTATTGTVSISSN